MRFCAARGLFKMAYLVNEKSETDKIFTVQLEILFNFQKIAKFKISRNLLALQERTTPNHSTFYVRAKFG